MVQIQRILKFLIIKQNQFNVQIYFYFLIHLAKSNELPKSQKSESKSTAKKQEGEFINCDQENELTRAVVDQLEETTPYFAIPENAMDLKRRKRTDPDYDPTSLYVPPQELQKCTPVMKQYWEIKSTNYDKILFFKLGKFYELFYEDALISHKELDLNWMGKKMHTGFPEKVLDKMAAKLIQLGYKIAIAEQTETPAEMQERLAKKIGSKCVQRELVQVMTKGTYDLESESDHQPRYLMSIRNFQTKFGIVISESSTNIITIGYLNDDVNFTQFKTLLCQLKPKEVVYDPDNMTHDIKKILQSGYLAPQLSPLQNKNNNWDKGMAYNYLDGVHGDVSKGNWPKLLNNLYKSQDDKKILQFEALSGLFSYLKSILIMKQVISVARYQAYDVEKGMSSCMILDSQSLLHLEVLEASSDGISSHTKQSQKQLHQNDGSLLGYINKTKTPFGYRMLKNWICAPLMNVKKINDRYDAIEDLQGIDNERDCFLRGIQTLPDLEKMCGRIYKYSIKQQNQNIVHFEDISYVRLKEFKELTTKLIEAEKLIKVHLTSNSNKFKSKRLRRLVTPIEVDDDFDNYEQNTTIYHGYSDEEEEDEQKIREQSDRSEKMEIENQYKNKTSSEGLLPTVSIYLKEFESYISWEGPKGQEKPIPKKGVVSSYDDATEEVKKIEKKLQLILESVQQQMKDKTIKFVLKYEIEINEELVKGNKKPKNLDFTSKAGKFQRFQTSELKDLLEDLETAEKNQKKQMKEFCIFVFNEFYESHKQWDTLINIIAELDCLISMSRVSFTLADGQMCRPEIYSANNQIVPFLELKSGRHPCVSAQGVNFIPNDIFLGDIKQTRQFEDNKSLILLTGPNMGGKSTTLRMACIMAILAQIGCYVPAKSLRFSLVDRIFTRIGASDKLMEGKSTFFIEMEETSNAVKQGSKHSLIIMDELGRGTSTFDGVAIAYSILKYITEHLQSRCLFATHYHVLLDEFRHYPQIAYYHMACHVDEKVGKVIFLYRLKSGECSSSFGINVAKIVGINESLIEVAKEKAKEFEQNINIQHVFNINKSFGLFMKVMQEFERDNNNIDPIIEQIQKIQHLN